MLRLSPLWAIISLAGVPVSAVAQVVASPYAAPTGLSNDITEYLAASSSSRLGIARHLMLANINVGAAANGTVLAAQSFFEPNYGYHWVRDASLTMDVVQRLYTATTSQQLKANYSGTLFGYAMARAMEQTDPDLQTGLGEPKFSLLNKVFTGPWGRPQNDGPATASITLMNFATAFMNAGGSKDLVSQHIYQAPLKDDLLFVASNWSSPSFDIWEEVESQHFYNRLVSHRALTAGAAFAANFGDNSTSTTLSFAAKDIEQTLDQFWDSNRNIISYASQDSGAQRGKSSFQDIAVILGIIHGYHNNGLYSYSNDRVLATAYSLAMSFLSYPIASQTTDPEGGILGIPIGRYPEDEYTGTGTAPNGGNPWFLCTAAMAELFYRAAQDLSSSGSLNISSVSLPFWTYFAPGANLTVSASPYPSDSPAFTGAVASLLGWGDAFLRLLRFHGDPAGHLSEEFSRETGYMVGAADLTWSYAALLTAALARAEVLGDKTFASALADLPLA